MMEQPIKSRVVVVTDSTADIPREIVAQHGLHVVPQILIMGTKTWRDGVDIDSATFYRLLRTSPDFPSTSQPSATEFEALFRELSAEAGGIVAVVVSDELSGTLNSARAAAASLPDLPIEIIDSRTVSMGLGLMALTAARAAARGEGLAAVAESARQLIPRVQVYFVVDTLEYLHRGGRIGAAARLFGSALNLKPVLQIKDGMVTPVTRVRTRRKALDKLLEMLREELGGGGTIHMAVLHIAAPEEAAKFGQQIEALYHPAELIQAECGPVVGTHAGPGTVGVAFYVE
jgi:DegV family protein with EDD domain